MFPSPPSLTKTERLARKIRIPRRKNWTPGSARRRLDFDESLTVVTSSQSSPDLVPALELPRAMASVSSPEQMSYSGEQQEEEEAVQDLGDAVDTQKEMVERNGSEDGDDFNFDSSENTSSKSSLCATPNPTSEIHRAMRSTSSSGRLVGDDFVGGDDTDDGGDAARRGARIDDTEDSGDDQDDLDSEAPNVVHHLEEHYDLRPRRNNEWFGMSDEDRNANQELVNGILEESNRDEKVSGAAHSLLQRVSETFVTTVFKDTVRKEHVTTAAKLRGKRKRMGSEVEQLDRKKHKNIIVFLYCNTIKSQINYVLNLVLSSDRQTHR